jgi:hypothetical protein
MTRVQAAVNCFYMQPDRNKSNQVAQSNGTWTADKESTGELAYIIGHAIPFSKASSNDRNYTLNRKSSSIRCGRGFLYFQVIHTRL